MLDVLNAATGTLKHFAQNSFALGKRLSPNVFSVVHQKIEGESNGCSVIDPAMECIELGNAIRMGLTLADAEAQVAALIDDAQQTTLEDFEISLADLSSTEIDRQIACRR
jgi:hypothetical protein